jgi:hypothetical protein
MPVNSRFHTISVRDLLADESVQIPVHQRPEIWDVKRKSALVRTVLNGLPMGLIIVFETVENGKRTRWLEDGQQRYWSMFRYRNDAFRADAKGIEKFYSELTAEEQACFNWYQIPVLSYENVTPEERLYIFQYLQNGIPLTSGQRYHAIMEMSPLVRLAQELMFGNTIWNARFAKAFGFGSKPLKDNKSKTQLQNAMAIVGGLALGPGFITTSYEILGPELIKEVPGQTMATLDSLLKIYEKVQDESAWSNAEIKKYQWPVGKITGYILWSLLECVCLEGDIEQLSGAWIAYLLRIRSDRKKLNILHKDMPSSRNWSSERWRIGFDNVFIGGPSSAVLNEGALCIDAPEALDSDDEESEL